MLCRVFIGCLKAKGMDTLGAWSADWYRESPAFEQGQAVEVLTPKTVVDVIGAGDVPRLNESAPA